MTNADVTTRLAGAVDPMSRLPYYVQVKDTFGSLIAEGAWRVGDRLPGEPELCRTCGVSRTVIRQALTEMTYEGSIVRRKGKGTFVAPPKIEESLVQKLTGFHQDMVERGYTPVTHVLKQCAVAADAEVARRLCLEPATEVIEIERVRFVRELPIVHVTTFLPSSLCPGLLDEDLSRVSLYAVLEGKYGLALARGRRTFEAVPAGSRQAALLQVKPGAPLVMLDSISFLEDGRAIEYYRAYHRGDMSRFEVELIRAPSAEDAHRRLIGHAAELPRSNSVARTFPDEGDNAGGTTE